MDVSRTRREGPQHSRGEAGTGRGRCSRRWEDSGFAGEQGTCPVPLQPPGAPSLGGLRKTLKIYYWGHVRGLKSELRSSIEDACSTAFDHGVFRIQTAAILQGAEGISG